MTKIVFPLEQDQDGYPPASSESVWAKHVQSNQYEIANIPFYARDVSLGDIVEAEENEHRLEAKRVVQPSGHSTIHVLFVNPEDALPLRQSLRDLGSESELSHQPALIAVDVPAHVSLAPVREILDRGERDQLWTYEESSVAE